MYRPLMLLCCISFALNPVCLASFSPLSVDSNWQEEVRALLEDDSWLQPSGPGHGFMKGYDQYQPDNEDEDLRTRKRALSALSRWKPFTNAWGMRGMRSHGGRAPLVSAMLPTELDLLSADTRTVFRPKGQPLRYGRR